MSLKKIYYYIHDNSGLNNIAVVLMQNGVNKGRGVAITNSKDQFDKKFGRTIAEGRALKAMVKRKTCNNNAILREEVITKVPAEFISKCEFMPTLTKHETELISKIK